MAAARDRRNEQLRYQMETPPAVVVSARAAAVVELVGVWARLLREPVEELLVRERDPRMPPALFLSRPRPPPNPPRVRCP